MKTFLSTFSISSLVALATACEQKVESIQAQSNTLTQYIADDSFKENTIDARFIPVLDSAEDVRMGARFDTLTGKIVGSSPCIANFEEADNGNEHSNVRLVEVSDGMSQMTALDIDVSVQGSYLGSSANAKASFASKQEFSQQTQNFLFYAKAERKPRIIEPGGQKTLFELTSDAKEVMNDRQAFRDRCGDAFVVAIFEGIELFAMLNFQNSSQAAQRAISSDMGGSYGGWTASAKTKATVETAIKQSKISLDVQLAGYCDVLDISGDETERWEKIVSASGKLQACARQGGNITSYKIIPYSRNSIKDWPFDKDNDPQIEAVLFYLAGYAAVLDSINTLLTNKDQAYKVALLNRGTSLEDLDNLAGQIRMQRGQVKKLLSDCQASSNIENRVDDCKSDNAMQSSLQEYVHPYIYRAQLPLFFVEGKPKQAFWSNQQIADAMLNENVQHPRDIACQFADKANIDNYAGCPDNFEEIKSAAVDKIKVENAPWKLDHLYMFQSMSTSNKLCMVAPQPKVIVKAAACNFKKPETVRQRLRWLATGQLNYRQDGPLCIEQRGSAKCDSTRPGQLWRFVPSQKNKEVGLIQDAQGKCLTHSNVDKNVTHSTCYGGKEERFYHWKPIAL